jgi:hypothetical protein
MVRLVREYRKDVKPRMATGASVNRVAAEDKARGATPGEIATQNKSI